MPSATLEVSIYQSAVFSAIGPDDKGRAASLASRESSSAGITVKKALPLEQGHCIKPLALLVLPPTGRSSIRSLYRANMYNQLQTNDVSKSLSSKTVSIALIW
jgi:hypothetical protein